MKKSLIAASAASLALAAMPVVGVFADTTYTDRNTVTDVLNVKLPDSCSMSATAGTGGAVTPSDSNTVSQLQNYTATYYGTTADTIANGQSKEYTATTIKVICNDAGGWMVNAVGANTATTASAGATDMAPTLSTSTPIASMADGSTETANPSGAASWWAMKLTTPSGTPTYPASVITAYQSWHSIPSSATKVAYGPMTDTTIAENTGIISGTGSEFTTNYKVYIGTGQQADTYTGKVTYTLVHPNDTTSDNT